MSDGNGHEPPESLRGRFKLTSVDGGAMLGWTTELCDRCLECGCGKQMPHLDLTAAGSMKTFLKLRQWQKDGLPK